MKRLDLTGQTFGKLTITGFAGMSNNRSFWKCICACGKEAKVNGKYLKNGNTRSCGCIQSYYLKNHLIHGGKHTTEYRILYMMRNRCYNKKNNHYRDYGGRGIKVCDRWLGKSGYINFLHDMGKRPSALYSIDRFPNNDGNYEPSNCRWATWQQLKTTMILLI